jgi:DNA-binding beta-propeller fold protein YncE
MRVGAGEYTYELIEDFARLPEGQSFGLISRVATDSEDRLFVFQRKDPAVLVFDKAGQFLWAWGNSGEFKRPHGFKIVNDLAYVVDQVDCVAMIYTLDGRLLRTIGTRGQPSDTGCEDWHNLPLRAAGPFNHPTEMMPGPSGDLYVTDGYRNTRVHRFTKDGELIQSWGQPGKTAPGDFHLPHSLAISPDGNVYVCDRANARVQIFRPDGKFIGMWTGMGGPNEIARDRNGIFYLCEQASSTSKPAISVRDGNGKILARWEADPMHAMGIDSAGHIYVGMTQQGRVNKYARVH